MMALVYATPEQLAEYTGKPAPADAGELLRKASSLVRRETRAALYDTDAQGLPTDSEVATAMREATCIQADAWSVNGVTPGTLGSSTTRQISSKSLGGRSVTYEAPDPAQVRARAALLSGEQLVREARDRLEDAGLRTNAVWV